MLQFSDFECPFCGKFSTEILPALQAQYIRAGRVLFAFRHLPLESHPNAEAAALAATCAAEQEKFGAFHDLVFANPKALDRNKLAQHSVSIGLDPSSYAACLETTAPARVKADTELARMLGVTGTPSFFIGKLGQDRQLVVRKTIKGTRPLSEFVAAMDEALAAK